MKRTIWGLGLAAATVVALISACGDVTSNTDGGGGNTCSSDAQCGTGKMCHPVSKACVSTCTGASDCPSTAKTCDVWPGSSSTAKFCQCASDALCNGGSTGSLVCSPATKTCEAKCTTGSCPSGTTCDTATGYCNPGGGGQDSGVPDAGSGEACSWTTCSSSSDVCNLNNHFCEPRSTCSSSSTEPAGCQYAQYCASDSYCAEVTKPTCANFNPSAGGKTPTFNPDTSTGPIIYWVEDLGHDDLAFCPASNAFSLKVHAYRSDAQWPAQKDAVSGFKYVRTDGTELDATTVTRPSGYTPNGYDAAFKVTLCSDTVTSNLSAGFYFTGGNEACGLGAMPNEP